MKRKRKSGIKLPLIVAENTQPEAKLTSVELQDLRVFLMDIRVEAQRREAAEQKRADEEKAKSEQKPKFNPLTLSLLGGIGTLFLAAATHLFTTISQLRLERSKFEQQLIQECMKDASSEVRANNFSLLVKAGLIKDPDGKIQEAFRQTSLSFQWLQVEEPPIKFGKGDIVLADEYAANIQSDPSRESDLAGRAKPGVPFTVTGAMRGSWMPIQGTDSGMEVKGWVIANFFKRATPADLAQ